MKRRSLSCTLGLSVAILLAIGAATATANRLSVSNRNIRAVWTPVDMDNVIECNLTMEGTFHSATFSKTIGGQIGHITRSAVSNCSESFTVLTEDLPWPILYQRFTGRLPRIASLGIAIVSYSLNVGISGIQCLYRAGEVSPVQAIANINEATGQVTGLRMDETAPISLAEGGFLCPDEMHFSGTGTVRQLGSTTALIFIRLI